MRISTNDLAWKCAESGKVISGEFHLLAGIYFLQDKTLIGSAKSVTFHCTILCIVIRMLLDFQVEKYNIGLSECAQRFRFCS